MLKARDLYVKLKETQSYVVKGVSFSIERGSVHALIGANGSGKTSLAFALAGHPKYELEGTAIFNGKALSHLSPEERFLEGLFLVFQHPPVIEGLNVRRFLEELYKNSRPASRAGKGSREGKENAEETKSEAFDDILKEGMKELKISEALLKRSLNKGFSGGEKKKLELLQLLLVRPKLAILDEVDAGLDAPTLERFEGIAKRLKEEEGTAFLLITHNLHILEHMKPDRVHFMAKGRIIESGPYELVKEAHRVLEETS